MNSLKEFIIRQDSQWAGVCVCDANPICLNMRCHNPAELSNVYIC